MTRFVVTIDGPAASGKSTVARLLADKIGATFLDTGAMYRAVTWAALQDGVDLADEDQLAGVIERHAFAFEATRSDTRVFVDGTDITGRIRDPDLTANVRHVASSPVMRARLVEMQRQFAQRHDRVVTEGRDQGTVAFPDAAVKFYLVADAAERARRRKAELDAQGKEADFDQLRAALVARDASDENRAVGPLKPAADAILVDTTMLSIEKVVERLVHEVTQSGGRRTDNGGQRTEDGGRETEGLRHLSSVIRRPKYWWYWVARFICQVLTLLFFRYRVYGRRNIPARGGVILAGNHQSFLDPVFCGIGATRPLIYMARETLFRGFFGRLIHSVNAIPVHRDRADVGAMKMVIARLKEGAAVCVYPEGTRSADGRIAAFKAGFGLLCRRSGATVVPVLVDGAFECWPRHKTLFAPGPIMVWFGKPLLPGQIRLMSNEQLADRLTRTLRQMQHDARLKQGKQPYVYDD